MTKKLYTHFNPEVHKIESKIATVRTSHHCKYNINYYIIWIPKYRKSILTGKVVEIIKKFYGSNINDVYLVLLRGSQKPESDIDLFVVSNNYSRNYFNGWLDIYELNREDFNRLSTNLDIIVTDPIFSGKLIYGDKNYFGQLKQQIQNQPITKEAVDHNLKEAEKQKSYWPLISEKDKRRKDCLSYIDSFSQNAEQLILGNKHLSLANLKQIYTE
ncbi:MAG: hypothetical protein QXG00_01705 [Candidatus Woesearchaeota archaeon]